MVENQELPSAPDEDAEKQEQLNLDFETMPPIDKFRELEERNAHDTAKKRRNWWIKTLLMLILVGVSIALLFTLGNIFNGEDTAHLTFGELLHVIDWPMFGLLLGVILLYIVVESGKYAYMLKVTTGKFHFRTSVKTMFLGKYYDGITPLSTGGQPFQIYYLHKKNVPSGAASAIPVMRYIVSIFFLSTLSVILLIITPRFLERSTVNLTVLILSWISLGINIMFPIAITLFSIFPNACKKLIVAIVGFLAKLHIVKHKYKTTQRFVREMTEYSIAIKQFLKNIFKYVPLIILCIIESVLFVTLPFFVVIAIADIPPTFELAVQIACLVVISRYTALLIPTPGNTGAMEIASTFVFVTVISQIGGAIGWVILVWRFVTYYVYILSGIGINIFEIIRSAVRNKRVNKNQPTE